MLFLTVLSGVAWTVVYVDAIRVGLHERTYAVPVAALALNIAWEAIYSVHGVTTGVSAQSIINAVWTAADAVIVSTYIRFGRRELPRFVTRGMFLAWGAGVFLAAFVVQLLFVGEFGWDNGSGYAAFLQNLLMSGLFIAMFVGRRGTRGQTLVIAVGKWIGTLAPTIAFGVLGHSAFVLGVGVLCSLFDLAYIGLVLWARSAPAALASPASVDPVSAVA
ncbi:MAG: transmembrane-type terpene cyclase [Cellulomonas sp.]